jgi:serine/threonine protein phosphatase PrpC
MEDAFLVLEEENAFAVADAMGGPAGGLFAAQIALEEFAWTVRARRPLNEAFHRAHRRIAEAAAMQR